MNILIRLIKALYNNIGPLKDPYSKGQRTMGLGQVVAQKADPVPPKEDLPAYRNDERLTTNFTLYELTKTSKLTLQRENRVLTQAQVDKLRALAEFLEIIRKVLGVAVKVNSGYRCLLLNGATNGSSSTSQHPRCEAADIVPIGMSIEMAFTMLRKAAKEGKFKFGQLIIEKANRDGQLSQWIHASVPGTLDVSKVGQIMDMVTNAHGIPTYTLIETVA